MIWIHYQPNESNVSRILISAAWHFDWQKLHISIGSAPILQILFFVLIYFFDEFKLHIISTKVLVCTLFRNKIFIFDEMKYLNASRFATFLGYQDPEKNLRKMKKTTYYFIFKKCSKFWRVSLKSFHQTYTSHFWRV